jgi:hypothetical protein
VTDTPARVVARGKPCQQRLGKRERIDDVHARAGVKAEQADVLRNLDLVLPSARRTSLEHPWMVRENALAREHHQPGMLSIIQALVGDPGVVKVAHRPLLERVRVPKQHKKRQQYQREARRLLERQKRDRDQTRRSEQR